MPFCSELIASCTVGFEDHGLTALHIDGNYSPIETWPRSRRLDSYPALCIQFLYKNAQFYRDTLTHNLFVCIWRTATASLSHNCNPLSCSRIHDISLKCGTSNSCCSRRFKCLTLLVTFRAICCTLQSHAFLFIQNAIDYFNKKPNRDDFTCYVKNI